MSRLAILTNRSRLNYEPGGFHECLYYHWPKIHHDHGSTTTGAKLGRRLVFDKCFSEVNRCEKPPMNIRDRSVAIPNLGKASTLFVLRPFGATSSLEDKFSSYGKNTKDKL